MHNLHILHVVCEYSGSRDNCDFSLALPSIKVCCFNIARQGFCKRTAQLGYAKASHSHLAIRFQNAYGSKGFRKRQGDLRVLGVLTDEGLKDAEKNQERVTMYSEMMPSRTLVWCNIELEREG